MNFRSQNRFFWPKSDILWRVAASLMLTTFSGLSSKADSITAVWHANEIHAAQLDIKGELPPPSSISATAWSSPVTEPFGTTGITFTNQTLTVPVQGVKTPWLVNHVTFVYNSIVDSSGGLIGSSFGVSLLGQHMVAGVVGGGHAGEETPNSFDLWLYDPNLSGLATADPVLSDELNYKSRNYFAIHLVGTHEDVARLDITDLNGTEMPGVIPVSLTVDMRAIFMHPIGAPEGGSSIGMLLGGLGILALLRTSFSIPMIPMNERKARCGVFGFAALLSKLSK